MGSRNNLLEVGERPLHRRTYSDEGETQPVQVAGESVTIAGDFPASTQCRIWKYYTQALGAGNVIHARAKKDIKDFESRLTDIRAVFVYSPQMYQEVSWRIQMAGSGVLSPRPAVFCAFQHDDPDADPGLTLPLLQAV